MTIANWNLENIMFDPDAVVLAIVEAVSNQMPQAQLLSQIVESTQRRCVEIMLELVEEFRDSSDSQVYPDWTCDFPTGALVAWAAKPFRQECDVKQFILAVKKQYTKRMKMVTRANKKLNGT